jgi:hypothetical protein
MDIISTLLPQLEHLIVGNTPIFVEAIRYGATCPSLKEYGETLSKIESGERRF